MDTSKLNQYLALLSNVAVLIGIFLILLELNQNSDLMRAQMSQERTNLSVQQLIERASSDYIPEIMAKRLDFETGREWVLSLTPVERERLRTIYQAELNDIRNQYYLYHEGYLSPEIWNELTIGQVQRVLRYADSLHMPEPFEGAFGFREELKRIAQEGNIPFPNEDGSWNE